MKRRRRKEKDHHSLGALRERAYHQQGGLCYWCQQPMIKVNPANVPPYPPNQLTADHLVPKFEGGQTRPGNIVAACAKCNSTRHPDLNRRTKVQHDKARGVFASSGDDVVHSPFEVLCKESK